MNRPGSLFKMSERAKVRIPNPDPSSVKRRRLVIYAAVQPVQYVQYLFTKTNNFANYITKHYFFLLSQGTDCCLLFRSLFFYPGCTFLTCKDEFNFEHYLSSPRTPGPFKPPPPPPTQAHFLRFIKRVFHSNVPGVGPKPNYPLYDIPP